MTTMDRQQPTDATFSTVMAFQLDEMVFELLEPLNLLDSASRGRLLEKARRLDLGEGQAVLAKDYPWSLLYLIDGSLERQRPGAGPEVLEDGHPEIAQPLFPHGCRRETRITARCDSRLILIDRRLYELLLEQTLRVDEGPDLVDLDPVAAQLFKRLSDDYRGGRMTVPRLPELSGRISSLLKGIDGDLDRLRRVVELDPGLSARVVQAAGAGSSVISVAGAVRRLGGQRVRDLALDSALETLCLPQSPLVSKRLRKAHRHSVQVAAYSYVLAKRIGHLDPEHALLCGLLHDVGMFPVLCAADAMMHRIRDARHLDAIVWQLHGMIGGMLLESWGFNPAFVATAEEADNWRRNPGLQPDYTDVVLVAQLHSFLGSERMKGLPQFSTIPAFRKIAGREPGPRFSLRVLQQANARIVGIEKLLSATPS